MIPRPPSSTSPPNAAMGTGTTVPVIPLMRICRTSAIEFATKGLETISMYLMVWPLIASTPK